MGDDFLPDRRPSADPAALAPLAAIPYDARADSGIALSQKMAPKHIIHEVLFGLAFDMNQETRHGLILMRPACELVLLPELTEAVVIKPRPKLRGVQAGELCSIFHPVRYENLLRLKMVEQ